MDVVLLMLLVLRISGSSCQQSVLGDGSRIGRPLSQRGSATGKGADKPCYFEGKTYESGDRIPRNHVCHVCTCVRGSVDCLWNQCPPAPEGCTEMTFPHMCNPALYRCPIPEHKDPSPLIEVTTFRSRRSDIPPESLDVRYDNADCKILGVPYRTGDTIGVASHYCLDCKCARGEMYCRPKCCFRPAKATENSLHLMIEFSGQSRRPIERHPLHHLQEDFDRANS